MLLSPVLICLFSIGLSILAYKYFTLNAMDQRMQAQHGHHILKVVDAATGRGVPAVELMDMAKQVWITDSNGIAAYYDPVFMNCSLPAAERSTIDIFFMISSDSYEYTEGGWFPGLTVQIQCGGFTEITVKRSMLTQRLYRVTGQGIYRDSIVAGQHANISGLPASYVLRRGLVDRQAGVLGQDSVMTCIHRDRMYWFFGDTNKASHILGNFHVSGALTSLPSKMDIDIEYGLNLTYFVDTKTGFVKSLAVIEPSNTPTWLHAPVSLPSVEDASKNVMLGHYYKPENPGVNPILRGLVKWNDELEKFEFLRTIDTSVVHAWAPDGSHDLVVANRLYFGQPIPFVRTQCNNNAACYTNVEQYESFTPLVAGTSSLDLDKVQLERDEKGRLVYAWKKNTGPLAAWPMEQLVSKGIIAREEAFYLQAKSVDDGKVVLVHGGSVSFNTYRSRFVMIAVQTLGKPSFLGEIWYLEADRPEGPWYFAKKVLSHRQQTFYNPRQHPELAKEKGRILYFQGTFCNTFTSPQAAPVPLYDYNQIMYKLDLAEISLPQPVLSCNNGSSWQMAPETTPGCSVAFYAFAQPPKDLDASSDLVLINLPGARFVCFGFSTSYVQKLREQGKDELLALLVPSAANADAAYVFKRNEIEDKVVLNYGSR